jgi:hypothetical protein
VPLLILAIGAPALLLGAGLGVGATLLATRAVATSAAAEASTTSPTATTFTVSGSMVLHDGFGADGVPCSGDGGYSDIAEGTQVVISDESSKTLAVGVLKAGRRDSNGRCKFPFEVLRVPTGQSFYGIEVSHRGRLQYSESQIRQGLQLSLGD